jgi:hypothetical protein
MADLKGKTKSEKKALNQLDKMQKEEQAILKTAQQVFDEKQKLQTYVDRYIDAFYDFSVRYENNIQQVGNFYIGREIQKLKKDFQDEIVSATDFQKVSAFYGDYIRKYNIDNLARDTIRCLIKRLPESEVRKLFEQKQKEINDFIRTSQRGVAEAVEIADNALGLARDAANFSKKYVQNFSNLKDSLKIVPIQTINDVKSSQIKREFLNSILPIIISTATRIVDTIVNNICDEAEVGTFSFDDIPG